MKRDMDLAREILLQVEGKEAGATPEILEMEGQSHAEVQQHVKLL